MSHNIKRSVHDRKLAGVCAGFAQEWKVPVLYLRLAVGGLALAGLFSAGISTSLVMALYALAWWLLPEDTDAPPPPPPQLP
jgi:phage shock protein PspC (stress-responsive transcriptional regulator)